tara:strand:+ start:850 stop:1107 length:258 start_codon:yes stop_codon:yes gene_type:complete
MKKGDIVRVKKYFVGECPRFDTPVFTSERPYRCISRELLGNLLTVLGPGPETDHAVTDRLKLFVMTSDGELGWIWDASVEMICDT